MLLKSFILLFSLFALRAQASEFQLIGSHLLEYSIFKVDVYLISYYRGKDSEKLVLDYKMPVKRKHSLEGWKVGLKHKLSDHKYQQKVQWLYDHTFDVEKGDQLTIMRKNKTIEIQLNQKPMGIISDEVIAELAFEPWLGNRPVDEELKAVLLGEKKP